MPDGRRSCEIWLRIDGASPYRGKIDRAALAENSHSALLSHRKHQIMKLPTRIACAAIVGQVFDKHPMRKFCSIHAPDTA